MSPLQCACFLGIEINMVDMEVQLPIDKINKLKSHLILFMHKKKATRRDLERLAGRFPYCSTVVRGGRSFCSRVYLITFSELTMHLGRRSPGGLTLLKNLMVRLKCWDDMPPP